MISYIEKRKNTFLHKFLCSFIAFTFMASMVVPPAGYAQTVPATVPNLPVPGAMVKPTPGFAPAILEGITIDPENPLQFDFIIDTGHSGLEGEAFRDEATKLIKYFLASLTVPEEEMWVNLSPYEKGRIIPASFGATEMGRDLLAQDYMLKQLTSSLMFPDEGIGKEFWERVHTKARERFGTTEVPMNTFNKIWIVPQTAEIYEHARGAFIVNSHLKVMLEEDYLALSHHQTQAEVANNEDVITGVSAEVVREILIPEIEREVNEGKIFAQLRQIYNSMILASWYKNNLKETLLGQVYVDRHKTAGIEVGDKEITQKIYDQYIEAYKKGVFDFIREDYDPVAQQIIPRKYFSGGLDLDDTSAAMSSVSSVGDASADGERRIVTANLSAAGDERIGVSVMDPVLADTAGRRSLTGRDIGGLAITGVLGTCIGCAPPQPPTGLDAIELPSRSPYEVQTLNASEQLVVEEFAKRRYNPRLDTAVYDLARKNAPVVAAGLLPHLEDGGDGGDITRGKHRIIMFIPQLLHSDPNMRLRIANELETYNRVEGRVSFNVSEQTEALQRDFYFAKRNWAYFARVQGEAAGDFITATVIPALAADRNFPDFRQDSEEALARLSRHDSRRISEAAQQTITALSGFNTGLLTADLPGPAQAQIDEQNAEREEKRKAVFVEAENRHFTLSLHPQIYDYAVDHPTDPETGEPIDTLISDPSINPGKIRITNALQAKTKFLVQLTQSQSSRERLELLERLTSPEEGLLVSDEVILNPAQQTHRVKLRIYWAQREWGYFAELLSNEDVGFVLGSVIPGLVRDVQEGGEFTEDAEGALQFLTTHDSGRVRRAAEDALKGLGLPTDGVAPLYSFDFEGERRVSNFSERLNRAVQRAAAEGISFEEALYGADAAPAAREASILYQEMLTALEEEGPLSDDEIVRRFSRKGESDEGAQVFATAHSWLREFGDATLRNGIWSLADAGDDAAGAAEVQTDVALNFVQEAFKGLSADAQGSVTVVSGTVGKIIKRRYIQINPKDKNKKKLIIYPSNTGRQLYVRAGYRYYNTQVLDPLPPRIRTYGPVLLSVPMSEVKDRTGNIAETVEAFIQRGELTKEGIKEVALDVVAGILEEIEGLDQRYSVQRGTIGLQFPRPYILLKPKSADHRSLVINFGRLSGNLNIRPGTRITPAGNRGIDDVIPEHFRYSGSSLISMAVSDIDGRLDDLRGAITSFLESPPDAAGAGLSDKETLLDESEAILRNLVGEGGGIYRVDRQTRRYGIAEEGRQDIVFLSSQQKRPDYYPRHKGLLIYFNRLFGRFIIRPGRISGDAMFFEGPELLNLRASTIKDLNVIEKIVEDFIERQELYDGRYQEGIELAEKVARSLSVEKRLELDTQRGTTNAGGLTYASDTHYLYIRRRGDVEDEKGLIVYKNRLGNLVMRSGYPGVADIGIDHTLLGKVLYLRGRVLLRKAEADSEITEEEIRETITNYFETPDAAGAGTEVIEQLFQQADASQIDDVYDPFEARMIMVTLEALVVFGADRTNLRLQGLREPLRDAHRTLKLRGFSKDERMSFFQTLVLQIVGSSFMDGLRTVGLEQPEPEPVKLVGPDRVLETIGDVLEANREVFGIDEETMTILIDDAAGAGERDLPSDAVITHRWQSQESIELVPTLSEEAITALKATGIAVLGDLRKETFASLGARIADAGLLEEIADTFWGSPYALEGYEPSEEKMVKAVLDGDWDAAASAITDYRQLSTFISSRVADVTILEETDDFGVPEVAVNIKDLATWEDEVEPMLNRVRREATVAQVSIMADKLLSGSGAAGAADLTRLVIQADDLLQQLVLSPNDSPEVDKKINELEAAIDLEGDVDERSLRQLIKEAEALLNPGGIDFNPGYLNMQIKRNGNGVILPVNQQPVLNMDIKGFVPVIINVTPVTNLPFILGMTTEDNEEAPANDSVKDKAIRKERLSKI